MHQLGLVSSSRIPGHVTSVTRDSRTQLCTKNSQISISNELNDLFGRLMSSHTCVNDVSGHGKHESNISCTHFIVQLRQRMQRRFSIPDRKLVGVVV